MCISGGLRISCYHLFIVHSIPAAMTGRCWAILWIRWDVFNFLCFTGATYTVYGLISCNRLFIVHSIPVAMTGRCWAILWIRWDVFNFLCVHGSHIYGLISSNRLFIVHSIPAAITGRCWGQFFGSDEMFLISFVSREPHIRPNLKQPSL
jgi:hypothetical protein